MKKILVIGLDAAEYSLVEKWAADGSLPNLRKFMDEGAFGRLESFAPHLPGANWYSFYLSQQPGVHGLYSYFSWQAKKMKAIKPSPRWIQNIPFWHRLQHSNPRGIVVNVPNVFMETVFNGIEVMSLASDHMLTNTISNPVKYQRKIQKQLRDIFYHEEKYDLMTLDEFLKIRDEMIELTQALKDLCIKMLSEENWDMFIAVLPGLHRAGHRLWSTVNITNIQTAAEQELASDALRQVYIATDQALGDMVSKAGQESIKFIFSSHGMMHNHSREAVLPEMLAQILQAEYQQTPSKSGILSQIRNLLPLSLRHIMKSWLPISVRQKITLFWRLGQHDWTRTRAFVIPLEIRIGIRINLKGRELKGIVEPGGEFTDLCNKIIDGLHSYRDADTGLPLVKEISFAKDIFDGDRVDWLPDLIGSWNDVPASRHRMITSPLYGDIPWPTPGHNPEGRSGNHANDGFLIAHGKDILSGRMDQSIHILDLAPTILSLLDQPVPEDMQGRVLQLLQSKITGKR